MLHSKIEAEVAERRVDRALSVGDMSAEYRAWRVRYWNEKRARADRDEWMNLTFGE